MLRKTITYLLLLTAYIASPAQEAVTGLSTDRIIYDNKKESKGSPAINALDLPFFDDFSSSRIVPDFTKWTDDFAFINNTYSRDQITQGIATLDALDNTGRLYETASQYVFAADQLTSQPLNLNYPASDSIWMSFLFQPGGLGDSPEPGDSLTLQFFSPPDQKWYSVWRTPGMPASVFRTVMIPVKDKKYLSDGFRFRFINYASLGTGTGDQSMLGNSDHWNIDYLLIDRNRSVNDTVFADVAFRLPMRSLLNTYETMPWEQFRQVYVYLREMGSLIKVNYRNNDTIERNVTRNFEVRDVYNNFVTHSFSSGASNIDPLSNVDYSASLFYTYNSNTADSALFKITCSLVTDEFDPKKNDTIEYYQKFGNYFAFDDGSSEGGYGVNGLGSRNAMVAYRFNSMIQDTLRAISICFNQSYMNSNQRTFDLMVWGDNNGVPGSLLYSKEEVVVHKGETINGFYDYVLPRGIAVSDIFYVGWRQRSETFMNAGFDVNTPHSGRQFYWLNGSWFQSQVSGSLMIRPVMGKPVSTGIRDILYIKRPQIKIWPNPAGRYLNIDAGDRHALSSAMVTVTDMNGRKLLEVPYDEQISIESVNEGICFLTVTLRNRIVGVAGFIKLK